MEIELLEIVYVDEDKIIEINKEYLNRDYVTDIITFSYNDTQGHDTFPNPLEDNKNRISNQNVIEGTIYCCTPRILEQSEEWNEEPIKEFSRILIHGLLHLLNYEDTSPELREVMRRKEDQHLADIYK